MIKYILTLLYVLSINSIQYIKAHNMKIELTLENSLIIRGEINEETTQLFLEDLYKKDRIIKNKITDDRKEKIIKRIKNKQVENDELYLFLDTPGGSVMHGLKIIDEIEKHDISCIVSRAYSMGFVILQYCKKRYIMKHATIMQHQISYSVEGEKAKIESMVNYIKSIGDELTQQQSLRIGINKREFEIRTYNDWWLYGNNIIKEKCADKIVDVYCSSLLINSYYNITSYHIFSEYTNTYSRCGLL